MVRKPFSRLPEQRFEGVGYCIYCEARDVPLSDEHVVPYAMGGGTVVRDASCAECAKKTSSIERRILKDFLGNVREALNFPTRRPKRRKEILTGHREIDGFKFTQKFRWDEYPVTIMLPILDLPGIADGREPGAPSSLSFWSIEVRSKGRKKDPGLISKFHSSDWCSYIAKVCHSAAFAYFGHTMERYYCVMRPIIAGHTEHALHFIGTDKTSELSQLQDAKNATICGYGFQFTQQYTDDGFEVLWAHFAPFSELGGPTYMALVGSKFIGTLPMQPVAYRDD